MSNYRKTSEYWLKRRRIANENKFAKMRSPDKARIVQLYIKSLLRWLFFGGVILLAIAALFQDIFLLSIGSIFLSIWVGLLLFYRRQKSRLHGYRNITMLQNMNPLDFEEYIIELYNQIGYKLKTTSASWDDGADWVWKDPKWNKIIFQIKRYADTNVIGSPDIRDFIGSMAFHNVTTGIFLTTSYFTKPAFNTVSGIGGNLHIELVDKDGLLKLLTRAYPQKSN